MDGSAEPVWIRFVADVEDRDEQFTYVRGSQWQVDADTAAALILIGAAERLT